MPRLAVWTVRAALLHLGVGFTLGALILFHKGAPLDPALWRLLPLHVEMLLAGWMVQLAMGVAFWILPRFRGTERGNVRLAALAVATLNVGVLTVGVGGLAGWDAAVVLGRVAELLAAGLFAAHAWPRVKPVSTSTQ